MKNNLMEASNQWATRPADERFTTLGDLRNAVHGRRVVSRSVDVDLERTHVKVGDDGRTLIINGETQPSEPTHWSFGQLSQRIGAPASYLRKLPLPLVVDNISYGIKHAMKETLKFMTVTRDDKPGILQAVTSTTYGRIWDADVVDAAVRIVEKTNGKFFNPKAYVCNRDGKFTGATEPSGLYASDRDVFIFMIDGGSFLDAGPRAQLNRGFFMWNSEVGARTMGIKTFLHNGVCGNHIVWGAENVNEVIIRHTSGGPYRFDSEALPTLLNYVNADPTPLIDTVKRAQTIELPAATKDETEFDLVLKFANKLAVFTKTEVKEAIAYARREEGDCKNVWQLVQGFTAYARGFDFIDSRTDLEARAGKLLDLAVN